MLLIDATGVDPADLDALHAQVSALTEAGRVATAVVMTGGPPPAAPVAQAVLTADGKLSVPAILGTEQIAAAALTGSDLDGLLALFANAEDDDVPIPPSVLDEPWATHMDDSGALIPPVVDGRTRPGVGGRTARHGRRCRPGDAAAPRRVRCPLRT